jgi:hypothetical protein
MPSSSGALSGAIKRQIVYRALIVISRIPAPAVTIGERNRSVRDAQGKIIAEPLQIFRTVEAERS